MKPPNTRSSAGGERWRGWALVCLLGYGWLGGALASSIDEQEPVSLAPAPTGRTQTSPWFPLVQGEWATFIYQADHQVREVVLASDLHGWDPAQGARLQQLQGGPVWALSLRLPRAARLEYKFVVDGEWVTDPCNPNQVDNGLGGVNSVLAMPDYRPPPEVEGAAWQGTLQFHQLESGWPTERRQVEVYLPPGYRTDGEYPVLWVLDGSQYLEYTRLPIIVENLVAAGALRPCLIVFVDAIDRMQEYALNPATGRLFTQQLIPWLHAHYAASVRREEHAILGASLGGLAAAYLAWRHWEVFGAALVQSGSFQLQQGAFARWFQPRPAPLIQLRLSVGEWEGELYQANQRLREILGNKAVAFTYQQRPAGHNWTAWRDALPDLLRHLWPAGPDAPLLGPPYPPLAGPAGESALAPLR